MYGNDTMHYTKLPPQARLCTVLACHNSHLFCWRQTACWENLQLVAQTHLRFAVHYNAIVCCWSLGLRVAPSVCPALSVISFLLFFLPFLVWPALPTHCRRRRYYRIWSHSGINALSIGGPWTRDRPVAETYTWQQSKFKRDRHQCPLRDSNPQLQQASGRRPTH
jgi:hypothetical protein